MNAAATLLTSLFLWLGLASDGWLGVFLAPVEPPQVAEVVPGSPADKAGIKPDDRFLAVDDKAVATRDEFVDVIRGCKRGQRVKLKLLRNGSEMVVVVQLGERPEEGALPSPKAEAQQQAPFPAVAKDPQPPATKTAAARPFLGVALEPADGGLRVSRVVAGSPAAAAGIAEGDVLVKWAETAVADFAAVERQLLRSRPGEQVALQLRSGSGVKSVLLRLGTADGDTPVPASARRPAAQPIDATLDEVPVFGSDLAKAQATGKPVLVLFGAAWNGAAMAQRRAFGDPAVKDLLAGCECVFVDTDNHGKLAEAHAVQELPQLEWLVAGKTVAKQVGYLPPPALAEWLRARKATEPATAPGRAGEAAPDMAKELQEIRAELRELRRMIEQLRRG